MNTSANKFSYALLFLFVAVLSMPGFGQQPRSYDSPPELKGRVKSIANERVYVVYSGQYVGEKTFRTSYSEYDESNKVVLYIEYGNGQKLTRYSRSKDGTKTEISYFDAGGEPSESLSLTFHANWNSVSEKDLCSSYVTRESKDPIGKVDRYIETCADGSKRSEEVYEFGQKGELGRFRRSDIKGRSWEGITTFDDKLYPREYRYLVDDKSRSPYVQTMIANEIKYDKIGNIIEIVATSFDSTRPGILAYQYVEKSTITYIEK